MYLSSLCVCEREREREREDMKSTARVTDIMVNRAKGERQVHNPWNDTNINIIL